jgi:hypothetical protein
MPNREVCPLSCISAEIIWPAGGPVKHIFFSDFSRSLAGRPTCESVLNLNVSSTPACTRKCSRPPGPPRGRCKSPQRLPVPESHACQEINRRTALRQVGIPRQASHASLQSRRHGSPVLQDCVSTTTPRPTNNLAGLRAVRVCGGRRVKIFAGFPTDWALVEPLVAGPRICDCPGEFHTPGPSSEGTEKEKRPADSSSAGRVVRNVSPTGGS